jgi:two-component system, NarL family, nitrate/nitrite response regulator NarL
MHNQSLSILFVEDYHMIRHAIKLFLKSQSRVSCQVKEASSLSEANTLFASQSFDLVLLDLSLPDADYCSTLRRLKEIGMVNRTLVLTSNCDEQVIRKCFSFGIGGYLLKLCSPEELVRALITVHRGDKYYCNEAAQAVLNGGKRDLIDDPSVPGVLSKREFEILKLVARDYNNAQIADLTHLSVRTVEGHRRNIRFKLNIQTTAGLIKYALEVMKEESK